MGERANRVKWRGAGKGGGICSKARKRNSGNSIAEVKGNYKKVNVEEKSAWGLHKKREKYVEITSCRQGPRS